MGALEKVVERRGRRFLLAVEDSGDHRDYLKYEDLRQEIWGWAGDAFASTRNMMCENFLYDGSSLYIGLYAETEGGGFGRRDRDHLVGFSYGFVGVKDKRVAFRSLDNLQFYSQYTGTKKGFERFGLGILIKEFQREALLSLYGIRTVTCTYDPLTGVNAHRNVHHFGMEVVGYNEDIYGEFGGYLNRVDVPSDRFTMSWDLGRAAVRRSVDLAALLPDRVVNQVKHFVAQGRSGPLDLPRIGAVNLDLDHDVLLVEIPFDFYLMLSETDVAEPETRRIPLDWRVKTREIFQSLFARGYQVIDFRHWDLGGRRRDFYVLGRKPIGAGAE